MLRTLFTVLVLALVLFFQVTPVLAECTRHTYSIGDRLVACRTCCDAAGNCRTTCLEQAVDLHVLPFMLNLLGLNLGLTILGLLLVFLYFFLLVRYMNRGLQEQHASLERIEASAERIAQMVEKLHNR